MSYAGTLTLTQPAAYQIFQRDTRAGGLLGLGTGTVPLAVNASAVATSCEYRLRDATNPGTVIAPWSSTGAGLVGGQQVLSIGVPATTGWNLIDVRANGDPLSAVSTTNPVAVGEVIAAAGQSLVTDFWDTNASGDLTTLGSLGVVPSTYSRAYAAWNGNVGTPSWTTPGDEGLYPSAFAAELLRLVVALTGVNAALVGYGNNGTAIASWQAGQPNGLALKAVLDASGGKFGTFIWCQGHQDAKAPGANGASYLASLRQLMGGLASSYAFPFSRLLCSVPSLGTAAAGRFDVGSVQVIRQAHLQYVSSDSQAQYVAALDVPLAPDGIHPSQAGNVVFARHFYRAFAKSIGAQSGGDAGPGIAYAARASGSSRILLAVRPASSLATSGDGSTQFQVFPAGQVTAPLSISNVDTSTPGQIVIALSSAPTDAVALDVWYRRPLDGSSVIAAGIYDTTRDRDGLLQGRQLALLATPMSVVSPAWHRPILVRPGVPILAAPGAVAFAS